MVTTPKKYILDSVANVVVCRILIASTRESGSVPMAISAGMLRRERRWELDYNQLRAATEAPFPCGKDDLVILYNARYELLALGRLGWPLPVNILDLRQEICEYKGGNIRSIPEAMIAIGLERKYFYCDPPLELTRDTCPSDTEQYVRRAEAERVCVVRMLDKIKRRLDGQLRSREALRRGQEARQLVVDALKIEAMAAQPGSRLI